MGGAHSFKSKEGKCTSEPSNTVFPGGALTCRHSRPANEQRRAFLLWVRNNQQIERCIECKQCVVVAAAWRSHGFQCADGALKSILEGRAVALDGYDNSIIIIVAGTLTSCSFIIRRKGTAQTRVLTYKTATCLPHYARRTTRSVSCVHRHAYMRRHFEGDVENKQTSKKRRFNSRKWPVTL